MDLERIVPAPPLTDSSTGVTTYERGDEPASHLATSTRLAGTPWMIVMAPMP